jgi:hypothetical protein
MSAAQLRKVLVGEDLCLRNDHPFRRVIGLASAQLIAHPAETLARFVLSLTPILGLVPATTV